MHEPATWQGVSFYRATGEVVVDGKTMGHLTPLQSIVMFHLLRHAPRTLSREWLLAELSRARRDPPFEKAVDGHVCRIRRRLRTMEVPLTIRTHWGRGYSVEG